MKRYSSFFLVAAIGSVLFLSQFKHTPEKPDRPLTIYDTAVKMLKEFIIQANDTNLGFSAAQFAQLDEAQIHVDEGVNIFYLIQDSLIKSKNPLDSHLVSLGRRIFPVYYRDSLRSTITFDTSSTGWSPVIFDDSNIIAPFVRDHRHAPKPGEGNHTYKMVMAPSIHDVVIIERDSLGDHILPTKELKLEMGEDYPGKMPLADIRPIGKQAFIDSLKHHVLKLLGKRR